jgi:hypothetical protein
VKGSSQLLVIDALVRLHMGKGGGHVTCDTRLGGIKRSGLGTGGHKAHPQDGQYTHQIKYDPCNVLKHDDIIFFSFR